MKRRIQCEIAVIGAGPAGICAALAASRQGMDTVLVCDRPVLGGNSSSEIRVWSRGSVGAGNLLAEEMGIWGELKLENLYRNPDGNVLHWDEVLFDKVYAEKHLTLLLNTTAFEVIRVGSQIQTIRLLCGRTESLTELQAKIYVDCTGNGTVSALAGIPYKTGREGKDAFQEKHALKKGDDKTQGCSILIQSKRVDHPVPYIAPDYIYSFSEIEKLIDRGGRVVYADMQGSDCWWFEYGGQLDVIEDDQAIFRELKRIALGIWNYIKNSGRYDSANLVLEWIGTLPGRRASRRLAGNEILTEKDLLSEKFAKNAVCYGGWYMDSHPSGGIQSEKEQCKQIPIHCYGIPFGCFYNPMISNLLFAGRMASMSYVAFTSARVMNTCALMGQAAGTAAALCLQKQITPEYLDRHALECLLSKLTMDDALLCGRLPALDCRIYASSVKRAHSSADGNALPLREPVYLAYPAAPGQKTTLHFRCRADTTISLRRISKPLPSRRIIPESAPETITFRAGDNAVSFASTVSGFDTVFLEPNEQTELLGGTPLPGVYAGYCEETKLFSPWVNLQNSEPYAARYAGDGFIRPWNQMHAWVSDGIAPGGERLWYKWETPVSLQNVLLIFDPDLSMEIPSSHCEHWGAHHQFTPRLGMPRNLVRDYRLYALCGSSKVLLAEVSGNVQRRRTHSSSPILATELILEISATYGGDAVVYAMHPNYDMTASSADRIQKQQ